MISLHLIETVNTQQLVSLKTSDDAAAADDDDDDDEHPQERLVTKRRPTYLASGKWPSAARRLSARRALPKDTTALSLVVSLSTTLIEGYEDGIRGGHSSCWLLKIVQNIFDTLLPDQCARELNLGKSISRGNSELA